MPAKKNTTPKYVTKEILKKETNRLEETIKKEINRLDAKIEWKADEAVQSMKDYTDSRFNQLDQKMEKRFCKFQ